MTGDASRSQWRLFGSLANALRLERRLLIACAVGALVFIVIPSDWGANVRLAGAWNAGGMVYLGLAFALMSSCSTDGIKHRASLEDETRVVFFAIILLAIVTSFYAVFALIAEAKTLVGSAKSGHIGLAAATILTSWLVLQTVFTLHYAHIYYGNRDGDRDIDQGMTFPGDDAPDYWDFFYFTTSIGAASQTSDVAITSKTVRRIVAFQSVLAFVFNTTIVALAINLASGLV